MILDKILAELKSYGTENMRAQNIRNGAHSNQFGVRLGDIRKLAEKIKTDHKLAKELWKTNNIDAQLLAILLIKPKELSTAEIDEMVRTVTFSQVADWFNAYVVKKHPEKETLREKWSYSADPMAARASWSLTAELVGKKASDLNLSALLDRIESEMKGADPAVQWTMNSTLASIGIHFPDQRKRALEIGETLGVYRDYPVSKGCTSPFAPNWIHEMVSRKN